ncbi:MAG: ECF transporter S component [Clostridiaceae bacterium]|nr:ECF transporter S component [Clostridiaceae bacterium]
MTKNLVLTAVFVAVGVVLPAICHMFGMVGTVILPMHIPVLAAGLLLPLPYALAVAVLSPIIGTFATGMPALFPVLPLMLAELCGYAFFTCFFKRILLFTGVKRKATVFLSLILAMFFGRAVLAAACFIMDAAVGTFSGAAYLEKALISGIPGMVLQLFVIPPLVDALRNKSAIDAR